MKWLGFLFLISINVFSEGVNARYDIEEKPFVILIASYNNEQYARENIKSVLNQRYSNYKIIFINDFSTDNTLAVVKNTIQELHAEDKVIIINNEKRKLGLRNYYEGIVDHTKDEEIVVCLDGDDFLAGENVLSILNTVYSDPNREIWLTYGQFVNVSNGSWGWNVGVPRHIIQNNNFRGFAHMPTHLRTFYSWLFKRVSLNDLIYKDDFFQMTWDYAFMLPMLEMSGGRFVFIENLLYLYNDNNPINDHKVDVGLQRFYANYIRSLSKYKPLKHNIFNHCSDGDCIICNKKIKRKIYVEQNS